MPGGFRVQSVGIEGFRGFTSRREINLDGSHAFLLGQNGSGKSSIIEAIRWGLFGSMNRPNDIVANRGYSGRCRVELVLMSEGKQWNLRRTLLRGVTGGSDPVLTDEKGVEHNIREIMPQLDSVESGEGTHIISASQAIPIGRQPADLSPFERTVFRHLGLANPRALLSRLNEVILSQELTEKSLDQRLTEARADIDRQIAALARQRGTILRIPPWGGERQPTVSESETKVRSLIKEITGQATDDTLPGASLEALIEEADASLKRQRAQGKTKLAAEDAELQKRLASLEKLLGIQQAAANTGESLSKVQAELETALNGVTVDVLRSQVEQARMALDTVNLTRQVLEGISSLVSRVQGDDLRCPVCEKEHRRADLEQMLGNRLSKLPGDLSAELATLQGNLKRVEELEGVSLRLARELDELDKESSVARAEVDSAGQDGITDLADVEALASRLSERRAVIGKQIEDQERWLEETNAQLDKLKEEERFHQLQKELARLEGAKSRFERVGRAYQDLVSFGVSLRTIQRGVETTLKERLVADTPTVSRKLSHVFSALTHNLWYDRLVIAKDELPKLELKVSSSQDPLGIEDPIDGVLNGQSVKAVELAPYFAFGQEEEAPTEVYLVMLDDPTQAFDERHTEILVECLGELGRNVQLIVASQETTRFREAIPKSFAKGSYVIVEPTNWSREAGPELAVERG